MRGAGWRHTRSLSFPAKSALSSLAHVLPQQMLRYGHEPTSQHTVLDAAQTQCETGVLAQHTCHFAAQQSCLQVEQLAVSRAGTDDDGVQMGKNCQRHLNIWYNAEKT